MCTLRSIVLPVSLILTLTLIVGLALAEVSGQRGRPRDYTSRARQQSDAEAGLVVRTNIQEVELLLNLVANKYRMVRFRVENLRKTPLKLSSTKDSMDCVLTAKGRPVTVRGILRMQKKDKAFWRSLKDLRIRKALSYPHVVEAKKTVYFFVFFPKDKVSRLPDSFTWKIDSLGVEKEIVIRELERPKH